MGEMHLFGNGDYVGLNPLDDHKVNVSWVCDASRIKGMTVAEAFRKCTRDSLSLSERFDTSVDMELLMTSPLSHRVSQCNGPRSALIGDASGFVDPLTGEGIFVALSTAQMLASRLMEHPEWVFGDNLIPILRDYHRERTNAFVSKNRVSLLFQRIIRCPRFCNAIQRYLSARQQRADSFIGLVGNVYKPAKGLWHMVTASLCFTVINSTNSQRLNIWYNSTFPATTELTEPILIGLQPPCLVTNATTIFLMACLSYYLPKKCNGFVVLLLRARSKCGIPY